MTSLLALLPSIVVLVAVLGLGSSGLVAASLATIAAATIWLLGSFATPEAGHLSRAIADAGVLTTLVAAMIVPGVLFVEATRGRKSPEAIAGVVRAIGLSKPLAGILISIGIGVTVESLTGMGVSLLITVPLLSTLLDRRRAMTLALIGMSLMPFGALSISAHVASKLSGLPIDALSMNIVRVSSLPAFGLPLLALLAVPGVSLRDGVVAIASGLALVAGLAASTAAIGIELAGVCGGLAVFVLLSAAASSREGLRAALSAPGLRPYLVLLAAVAAQKVVAAPLLSSGFSPRIATDRVSFVMLTSPGVALLVATLLTAAGEITPAVMAGVARRAWRPVVSIALFMLSARILVECGAIGSLAELLSGIGRAGATLAVASLGAVGGFVTGSGVTGNALFMPSAAAVGTRLGDVETFAALQNSAGGHVAMTSVPVLAVLLAALPERRVGDDALAMRRGLAIAAWNVLLVTVAAFALMRLAA